MNFSDHFIYDETSDSHLRWVSSGKVAGSKNKRGYWVVCLNAKRYFVHRVIASMFGLSVEDYVDHIDGNPQNNNISNLREATPKINNRNSKKSSANTSGITGISFCVCRGKDYVRAVWFDGVSVKQKYFGVAKYGGAALEMAVQHRSNMLKTLSVDGEYTDRHGK